MSSFVISNNILVTQTLATGENGFITATGTIYTEAATAVNLTGVTTLSVMGTVATANGTAAVRSSGVTTTSITVGAQGSIFNATDDAIRITTQLTSRLNNAGLISGTEGVLVDGTAGVVDRFELSNTGTLVGTRSRGDILNNEFASAVSIRSAVESASIFNAGLLGGTSFNAINSTAASLDVINTGVISSGRTAIFAVALGLENSGQIVGGIRTTALTSIRNSGSITGSITAGDGINTLWNSGLITGNVFLGNGFNTFDLIGGNVTGYVSGGLGNDTFYIDRTDLRLRDDGGSADTVYTAVSLKMPGWAEQLRAYSDFGLALRGRALDDSIFGGGGDDTLTGGRGDDTLVSSEGDDLVFGGAGNDRFIVSGGDHTLSGGDGNDTFELSGAPSASFQVAASGDAGDDVLQWSGGSGSFDGGQGTDTLDSIAPLATVIDLTARTAVQQTAGGAVTATLVLTSIENAMGSTLNDTLTGSNGDNGLQGRAGNDLIAGRNGDDTLSGDEGNDTLDGGGSNDLIDGGAGNDSLVGGSGLDTLVGGMGRDTMVGGADEDVFVFRSAAESTVAAPDVILGFETERDVIDVEEIYGDPDAPVDVPFTFIGTGNFTGNGPELRYQQNTVAITTSIQIRFADSLLNNAEIVLQGLFTLSADNFIL